MEIELLPQLDVVKIVMDGWERFIESQDNRSPSNRPYCYASGYEPCLRKLVLQMTQGDKILPFPTEVKAKFRRGKDRETNLKADLQLLGRNANPRFEVIGQEKSFLLRDHKGRIAISGKVDLILDFGRGNPQVPCEIKDFASQLTDRIFTFDDVLRGKWTHKAARQTLCYLYGSGEPMGIIIFTRPGLPKLIPVYLEEHLDLVEEFLNKAEKALDHKEAGTLPDYIQDASECKRCSFYGSVCQPPISSGEGAVILTDPELEQQLLRYLEIEPIGEEYESLDSAIKEQLRGVELGLAGSVMVQGKWQSNTTYPLSKEAKAQIDKIKAPFKKVNEKGKFFLTVTKI
jgi:hypothetical protein